MYHYRESFMMEQALDLRIHSRRYNDTEEDEEPLDLSDTSASPEVDIVFTAGQEVEETQDSQEEDGDLVIVEAAVCDVQVNVAQHHSMDNMEVDHAGLLLTLHTMTDSDAQQKQTRSGTGRATVKHYPSVDRLISKSRLFSLTVP